MNGAAWIFWCCALGLAGVWAGSPALPRADAERVPPEGPRLLALDVHPQRIVLNGRFESVQIVLTGRLDDGTTVDLTRAAGYACAEELVKVDANGRVTPSKDGEGSLAVAVQGAAATVAVRVSGVGEAVPPSFVNDVMPLMTRIGCNAGGCHGAAKGRNGFKLSLRGYDPAADHLALTDDLGSRRVNRASAEESLFIQKPSGLVPHEGGRKIEPGRRDHALLASWVEGGAKLDLEAPRVASIAIHPQDPTIARPGLAQQMAVLATYADGTVRDVTGDAVIECNDLEVATAGEGGLVTALRRGDVAVLARYSGRFAATRLIVMGDRSGFEWQPVAQNNWIDEVVDAKLRALKTLPSGPCTDSEFVRRVHLDLTGKPPGARDVRVFLADRRDPKVKREELIDRLIGSTEFVEHWTNKWADLLQVNSKWLGKEGAVRLRAWIREQISSNRPYDAFAADVLGAGGSTWKNPPAAYWKILRKPDVAMENTTQLFLGIRFNCNKCHDHPFERWTLDQHWALAASFAQVGRENVAGAALMPRGNDNRPDDEEITVEEMVKDLDHGDVMHPNRNVVMTPAFPFEVPVSLPEAGTRRERLVRWITAKENPYFARSYVNRLWSYFLGVGLIDPPDDLRASNPPTNPVLLERLTASFVESGFDVRALMRLICRSASYQRSIATNRWNEDDALHYAHALARRLPAETLFDAINAATGHAPRVKGAPPDARADEFLDPAVGPKDGFLALFGRPPRESACECERTSGVSLGQALNLVNGPTLSDALADPDNALAGFIAFEKDPRKIVDELYLRFIARPATDAEFERAARAFDVDEAANVETLAPDDAAVFKRRQSEWEASLPKTSWKVLEDLDVRSSGGVPFAKQPDGSWLAGGKAPDTDTTTVVATLPPGAITAIRLEAIPDAGFPKKGSGRSESGNFVVGELKLTAVPLAGGAGGRQIALQNATSDFHQEGYPPDQIADGNPKTGWGVHPEVAKRHHAVWELAEDAGGAAGALLVLTIDQGWGKSHLLGRFRLSVTSSPRPVRASTYPDELLAALARPEAERAPEQRALVHAAFLKTAPDLADRLRLAAAQDLSWALATSPSFLFNR